LLPLPINQSTGNAGAAVFIEINNLFPFKGVVEGRGEWGYASIINGQSSPNGHLGPTPV